jgi:2-methylcitrate dehydratase PrpD
MSATLSAQLAAWFDALTWSAIPARQRELAQSRLLDTLGLIACGYRTQAASIARDFALHAGGAGPASMAAHAATVPAGWAAFVHGVAAHCYDFDDTFPESVVHPGSVIVPVALALGEETGASGRDVLTAIAGGYEIAARLGRIGGRRFHERGFHATGVFAPVTAAFVAARLLRLDAGQAASAAGLAASM